VLQEREFDRVGDTETIRVDTRVIAASNRELLDEVAKETFREDLYYRLNVFPLHLPALRERPLDILPLARQVIGRAGGGRRLSSEAGAALAGHRWSGNIRELENVIQRALILARGPEIEPGDLHLPASAAAQRQVLPPPGGMPPLATPADGRGPGGGGAGGRDLRSLERQHILSTLASVAGSRRKAAALLQMSERTLRHKLAQYRAEGWKEPGRETGEPTD
jgi:two-component system response regulator FlrC